MSTLSLSNSAHVEALRWACEMFREHARGLKWLAESTRSTLEAEAARTLSSPALSASLLRALLERCGVVVVEHGTCLGVDGPWPYVSMGRIEDALYWSLAMRRLPALILALLDIPADAPDRRERALAALKEHGR